MKLLTYKVIDEEKVGILSLDGGYIYALDQFGLNYKDMNDLITNISDEELDAMRLQLSDELIEGIPLNEVNLCAPIPKPKQDIICLGLNYMEHIAESLKYEEAELNGKKEEAVYFSKRVNEAVGSGGEIDSHSDIVSDLDYESELAVIIRKAARNVKRDNSQGYLFGYTILNDVSARTIQLKHKQWYRGKSLDGFTAMGPWIVTADEFPYPPDLDIKCKVNGELRQNSCTSYQIFNIPYVIEELSNGMTLQPGTIISTGTPSGVGLGFNPPKYIKSGDRIECAIGGIGVLENIVK